MTVGTGVVELPKSFFIPGNGIETVDRLQKFLKVLFNSLFKIARAIVSSNLGILFDLVEFALREIIGRYVFEFVEAVLHPGHMLEIDPEKLFVIFLGRRTDASDEEENQSCSSDMSHRIEWYQSYQL